MHSDFDFWIGDWDVTNLADGRPAGTNAITREVGGRVLVERYATPRGFSGMSVNGFDEGAGRWHQCWMDSTGGVLDLYGGLVDGAMVMSGETADPGAGTVRDRITWTPNDGGTVRQHWERSADGGSTWETVFDGLYTRRADGDASL
ncbi:MAG: hypothetical protein U0R50_05870 [Gaiellales bacterium]